MQKNNTQGAVFSFFKEAATVDTEAQLAKRRDAIKQFHWLPESQLLIDHRKKNITFNFKNASEQVVQYNCLVPPFSEWCHSIFEDLYIGGIHSLMMNYETTPQYSKHDLIIDFSLMFTDEFPKPPIVVDSKRHIVLDIHDNGNLSEILDAIQNHQLFEKINDLQKQGGKILINCAEGVSRSATFAILYMMTTYRVSFIESYHYLRHCRPAIEPNPGFVAGLLAYQEELGIETPSLMLTGANWAEEYRLAMDMEELFSADFFSMHVMENTDRIIKTGDVNTRRIFLDLVSYLIYSQIPFDLMECGQLDGALRLKEVDFTRLINSLENKPAEEVSNSSPVI